MWLGIRVLNYCNRENRLTLRSSILITPSASICYAIPLRDGDLRVHSTTDFYKFILCINPYLNIIYLL